MKINISYSLAAFHESARYIWENNPSVTKWPCEPKSVFDVMSKIHYDMLKHAKDNAHFILKQKKLKIDISDEWINFTGTGGYYLIYDLENDTDDNITIGVQILVDVSVGTPIPKYVTEELEDLTEVDRQLVSV